jgi:hypothetical protein
MTDGLGERWLPVPGYEESYEVSDRGRVRSLTRVVITKNGHSMTKAGRILRPGSRRSGHLAVGLCSGGEQQNVLIHRIVLEAFVGPCPGGMEACHENDIPFDNRLSNLRWDVRSANSADAVRNGKHPKTAKTHCPRGHEYSVENTYRRPGAPNKRYCRICTREKNRVRGRKRAAARRALRECA